MDIFLAIVIIIGLIGGLGFLFVILIEKVDLIEEVDD